MSEITNFHKSNKVTSLICDYSLDDLLLIIDNLYTKETINGKIKSYIKKSITITKRVRSNLIEYIIEMHKRLSLKQQTLFSTINILDKYLSITINNCNDIKINQLLPLIVSCLFISSKYNDINTPQIIDFIYITNHQITRKQILKMEQTILTSIHYKLTTPNSFTFWHLHYQTIIYYLKLNKKQQFIISNMSNYFLEKCLLNYKITITYNYSVIACASIYYVLFITNLCLNSTTWNKMTNIFHIKYKYTEIESVSRHLDQILKYRKFSNFDSNLDYKYRTQQKSQVSLMDFTVVKLSPILKKTKKKHKKTKDKKIERHNHYIF